MRPEDQLRGNNSHPAEKRECKIRKVAGFEIFWGGIKDASRMKTTDVEV